ncbi:carbamoyltransferase C-terminal domain-containing protein [Chelativorans xinjiangense]|uniref:carbamoyltransferase C-terminal domain-containing protein n=1 Tax=Chelativorans xinjiangense TaxID=2681485 RepID=UPI0013579762
MLRAVRIRQSCAEAIPAVTHVDGTGRLQTLTEEDNPEFHAPAPTGRRRFGPSIHRADRSSSPRRRKWRRCCVARRSGGRTAPPGTAGLS